MNHASGSNNKIDFTTNVFMQHHTNELQRWNDNLASLLQEIPSKAELVKPVILFLAATLHPAKIYLVNQGLANTNPSVFSLAVVLGTPAQNAIQQEKLLSIAGIAHSNIHLSVHHEANVIEKIRAGNPWYGLRFVPQNIVYNDHQAAYPVATEEQATSARQKLKATFLIGFTRAKRFYAAAENEFRLGQHEITLFMLHQAMELTCRAITKSLTGFEERVHLLRIQQSHMCRFAPELTGIFKEDKQDDMQLLDLLEKGYTDARYNYGFNADVYLMPLLFTKVKLFQDLALNAIERLAELNSG